MMACVKFCALTLVALALTFDLTEARKPLPFVGEVRWMAFKFAPEGWLLCDGKQYQSKDYKQLANIIGSQFGGDGKSTFKVPNLVGSVGVKSNAKDINKMYPVISHSGVYPVRHYS